MEFFLNSIKLLNYLLNTKAKQLKQFEKFTNSKICGLHNFSSNVFKSFIF